MLKARNLNLRGRQKLLERCEIEGLDEIVIEPRQARALAVGGRAVAGEGDKAGSRKWRQSAQLTHHLVPIHAGQADVEQYNVRFVLRSDSTASRPSCRHCTSCPSDCSNKPGSPRCRDCRRRSARGVAGRYAPREADARYPE